MLELIGMVLEHICKAYAEYGLVKIAYALVFELKVHHQLISDVEFSTSTKVNSKFAISDFCTAISEIGSPSSVSKTCQWVETDVAC